MSKRGKKPLIILGVFIAWAVFFLWPRKRSRPDTFEIGQPDWFLVVYRDDSGEYIYYADPFRLAVYLVFWLVLAIAVYVIGRWIGRLAAFFVRVIQQKKSTH